MVKGSGGDSSSSSRAEAERSLGMAEKLLVARDLIGSRNLALRAHQLDPTLEGPDQILAIADVLLASQERINNDMDWYAILQLNPHSDTDLLESMKKQYHKLVLLLRPDTNRFMGADSAFKLVVDAWAVLSDPSKRSQYDKELSISAQNQEKKRSTQDPDSKFWTSCPYCCNLYEYTKEYENCRLRCQNCRRPFHSEAIPKLPPIVPGLDAYYCAWGFFPLGIGGTNSSLGFEGFPTVLPDFGSGQNLGFPSWKPFFPIFSGGLQQGETWNAQAENMRENVREDSLEDPDWNAHDDSVKDPDWVAESAVGRRKKTRDGPPRNVNMDGGEPLLAVPISVRAPKKKVVKKAKKQPVRRAHSEKPTVVPTQEPEWIPSKDVGNAVEDPPAVDLGSSEGLGDSQAPEAPAKKAGEPQPLQNNGEQEAVDIPGLLKLLGVKDEEMNMQFNEIGQWEK